MRHIREFLVYNNAVPIAFGVLFVSFGITLAASGEVRGVVSDAVFSVQEHIISIDNTYIVNRNLDAFTPSVRITDVTEDDENYYVAYIFTTISLADYVWQDVSQEKVMKVAKAVLGEYGDLGLYVTEQLQQVIDRELAYLREVQRIERQQVSNKVVATAYSGLIGALLDDKTETIPGYVPVVTPPPPPREPASSPGSQVNAPQQPLQQSSSQGGGSGTLTVQLLGDNPARVPLNGEYRELGVVVSGNKGNYTLYAYVSGIQKEIGQVVLDTTFAREWRVRYVATDDSGAEASIERLVVVFNPMLEGSTPQQPASSQPSNATSSPSGKSTSSALPAATTSPSTPTSNSTPTTSPSSQSAAPSVSATTSVGTTTATSSVSSTSSTTTSTR